MSYVPYRGGYPQDTGERKGGPQAVLQPVISIHHSPNPDKSHFLNPEKSLVKILSNLSTIY